MPVVDAATKGMKKLALVPVAVVATLVAFVAVVAVAALPEIDMAYVPAARLFTVPLRVMLPLVVTVPDKLKPEAVPVPLTEVTVPVVELVPAPMAVRNAVASKEETVLSALKRGKEIDATFASVNKLPPSVVAPKFVRAAAAVVAPEPPLAMATVPVTFPAVVAVDALPDKVAVMVPALKLPEASRATTLEAVLAEVASTAKVRATAPVNVPVLVRKEPAVSAFAT